MLQAIKYENHRLHILDQLKLPHESVYEEVKSVEDGWKVIKTMKVRGAPAIAIAGSLSLAVELSGTSFHSVKELSAFVDKKLKYLITSRPTAVNLSKTAELLTTYLDALIKKDPGTSVDLLKQALISRIEQLLSDDISDNKKIGDCGSKHILANKDCHKVDGKVKILTHCNAGALATAGYGTALGVIRSLHGVDAIGQVYCTETRPYNQGARLTAYELVHDNIPSTLIADSMACLLMDQHRISAVVVGADRVTRNGDTANKIGTYQLAVVAKHHNVPFYIAAPFSSIDRHSDHGKEIEIEHRPPEEMTTHAGQAVAAKGIGCWNPAFDVTPNDLITGGIITERGVFKPQEIDKNLY